MVNNPGYPTPAGDMLPCFARDQVLQAELRYFEARKALDAYVEHARRLFELYDADLARAYARIAELETELGRR